MKIYLCLLLVCFFFLFASFIQYYSVCCIVLLLSSCCCCCCCFYITVTIISMKYEHIQQHSDFLFLISYTLKSNFFCMFFNKWELLENSFHKVKQQNAPPPAFNFAIYHNSKSDLNCNRSQLSYKKLWQPMSFAKILSDIWQQRSDIGAFTPYCWKPLACWLICPKNCHTIRPSYMGIYCDSPQSGKLLNEDTSGTEF